MREPRLKPRLHGLLLASTAFVAVNVSLVSPALSQSTPVLRQWTGAVDSDWSNSGNWGTTPPTTTEAADIVTTPSNQPVIGPGVAADVDSVHVDNGNSLLVTGTGQLTATDLISIGRGVGLPSSISIENGGTVVAGRVFLGDGPNLGSLTVDGLGSALTVNLDRPSKNQFLVGGLGNGNLTVKNGANVLVGGTGLLELGFSGGTTLGTLVIGDGGTAGTVTATEVRMNTVGSSIVADFTDTLTLSPLISGVGSLIKDGAGTLNLTGMNTYTGETVIHDGTLALSGQGRISGSSNVVVDGTLDVSAAVGAQINDLSGGGSVLLGGTTLMINNAASTFGGVISGASGVNISSGTQVFTGENVYTGSTEISSGAELQIGAGGTSGSVASNILNHGTLVFNRSDDFTFGRQIFGTGGLQHIGDGTLVLTGSNSMSGDVSIASSSKLQLGNGGTTGSVVGNILNSGTLTFNRADNVTYGGQITGNGSFEHIGGGTLILTANNSTSGNVRIGSSSTLQLGNGGITGHIGGTITNDGTLIYDRSNNVNWNGIYAGTGDLVQAGTGTLNLTGDSSGFAGTTIVQNGGLFVGNGSGAGKLGGDISVLNGAILGGSGTLGSSASLVSVRAGGYLAPGNSIGTMQVTGNLSFDSGSYFDIEVNDGGNVAGVNNDFVAVSGNVTIDPTAMVRVRAENGTDDGSTYAPGTSYQILSYGGTRTGMFDSTVDENFAFLDASLSYGSNAVLFDLTRNEVTFENVAGTRNQVAVANSFASFDPNTPAYQQMIGLSIDQARAAYDSMSGEVFASGQYMINGNLNLFTGALGNRSLGGGGRSTVPSSSPLGYVATVAQSEAVTAIAAADVGLPPALSNFWFSPLGGRGSVDGDGNGSAFDWSAAGVATGYETAVPVSQGDLTIGFGVGYLASWGDNSSRASSFDSQGGYLGIYGDWVDGPLSISGQLAYGLSRISTERDITVGGLTDTAEADYWSHGIGLGVETAYAFAIADGVTLSPLATLSVGWNGHDDFQEDGAGALNARIGSESNWWADAGLGFELAHAATLEDGSRLTLRGRALWGHRMGSTTADSTVTLAGGGAPFTVQAADGDRDRLIIGAGLEYATAARMSFSVDYAGEVFGSQDSHTGKIGIRLAF